MSNFADLRLRVISAIVMVLVGASAIWQGGWVFLALLTLVGGLMIWELARMVDQSLAPAKTVLLALIAGAAVLRVGFDAGFIALLALFLAPVLGLVLLKKDRGLFLVYGIAILFAVPSIFWLRQGGAHGDGLIWTLWLVLVVIASDIGGYFFGRIIGGPKILPVISPKKTWSGTLGGWALAACVGFGFVIWAGADGFLVVFSIFAAIAAQIGDVVESAIKRHTGVKDSSALIPGHGGFLDRFDALIGAGLFLFVITKIFGLPMLGAI